MNRDQVAFINKGNHANVCLSATVINVIHYVYVYLYHRTLLHASGAC